MSTEYTNRTPHPLYAGELSLQLRLFREFGTTPASRLRMLKCLAWGTFGTLPRMQERLRFDRRIRAAPLPENPIIILGHWRSGTTFLQNLLCQDNRFGYVSLSHAIFAGSFLTPSPLVRKFFERRIPNRRPMDNIEIGLTAPQEEEWPLGCLSELSFYHAWYFPLQARAIADRALWLNDAADRRVFKATYTRLIKRLSLANDAKPLILKNPANTARIPLLLELFPQAKFIHIYRDPYRVYQSTVHLWRRMIAAFGFHRIADEAISALVVDIYRQMMQRYLRDRSLILPNRLYEIDFSDLQQYPKEILERLYTSLDLGDFAPVKASVEAYLASQKDYQKNIFHMDSQTKALIEKEWGSVSKWPDSHV